MPFPAKTEPFPQASLSEAESSSSFCRPLPLASSFYRYQATSMGYPSITAASPLESLTEVGSTNSSRTGPRINQIPYPLIITKLLALFFVALQGLYV
jgi:hypothetical protein